jgi:vacuolar-type H+-ATPase subunit I/STV1
MCRRVLFLSLINLGSCLTTVHSLAFLYDQTHHIHTQPPPTPPMELSDFEDHQWLVLLVSQMKSIAGELTAIYKDIGSLNDEIVSNAVRSNLQRALNVIKACRKFEELMNREIIKMREQNLSPKEMKEALSLLTMKYALGRRKLIDTGNETYAIFDRMDAILDDYERRVALVQQQKQQQKNQGTQRSTHENTSTSTSISPVHVQTAKPVKSSSLHPSVWDVD